MKIQAQQLQEVIHSGKRVSLIDVRTPVEHDEMHISGSYLIPLDRLDPEEVKEAIEDCEQCVLICHGGKRAEEAYQKLKASGCEKLVILNGGVAAWEQAGLPLIRSEKARLPLIRQVQLTIGLFVLISSILAFTVSKNFALIPAFFGAGLTLAGSTGWCGLAILLSKMPWNKVECGGKGVTSCTV